MTLEQPGQRSLAKSSCGDVLGAHELVVDFVGAARHLARAASHLYIPGPHDPEEPCRGNNCPLGAMRGGAVVCEAAQRLTLLDLDEARPSDLVDAVRSLFD